MKKTISFAVLHFIVAFTVAYLLTGELLTASLIALIEPAVNTVAFYFHDLGWHKLKPNHSLEAKTSSFALVHFSIAFGVAYLLSGELLTGGVMAMIENRPSTQWCSSSTSGCGAPASNWRWYKSSLAHPVAVTKNPDPPARRGGVFAS